MFHCVDLKDLIEDSYTIYVEAFDDYDAIINALSKLTGLEREILEILGLEIEFLKLNIYIVKFCKIDFVSYVYVNQIDQLMYMDRNEQYKIFNNSNHENLNLKRNYIVTIRRSL